MQMDKDTHRPVLPQATNTLRYLALRNPSHPNPTRLETGSIPLFSSKAGWEAVQCETILSIWNLLYSAPNFWPRPYTAVGVTMTAP